MLSQLERAEKFRALHQRPAIFVMPNPWDAGSAKLYLLHGRLDLDDTIKRLNAYAAAGADVVCAGAARH